MSDYLMVYGASDDLIEVEGRIEDEFNVPGKGSVKVTITNRARTVEFVVSLEFTGGWGIAVASGFREVEFPVEVEFGHRENWPEDAAVTFTLSPDDEVKAELL